MVGKQRGALSAIRYTQTLLSISVTDPQHTVHIISVQILDLKDRIYHSLLLTPISNDFYTTQPFIAPTKRFKIAVLARDVKTGKYIRRIAKLSITPQEPPQILPETKVPEVTISEGKTIEVTYGQRLKLTCKVTAYPEPDIEWYKTRSVPIKSQRSVVEPPYKYISYLEISRVVNNASYTCRSQNDEGSGSAVINVIVKEPFVVKSAIKGITKVEYGTRGVLRCDITASVPMRIRWYAILEKVDARQELVTSNEYTISGDGTTLTINKMDLRMVKTYSCEASLDENEHVRSIHRTQVQISGLTPPHVTGDDNIEALKGSSVNITCHVTGAPKPTITWSFKAEGDSEFVSIYGSRNVLHKSRVEEYHAGTYKCIAHNVLGKREHQTTLNVLIPPNIVTSSTSAYTSVEGKDAVMRIPCAATGLPKPVITWMVDGAVISESTKFSIQDGSLIIREPKVSDTGSYTCVAQNDAGATRASFQANILQIPDILGDKSKTIKKGDSTTIKCDVVKGVPRPSIKWYFKAKSSSEFVPLTGRTKLNIEKADKTHTGTYKCVAENIKGRKEHRTDLTVEFAPTILSDESKPLTGVEGDIALRIPCEADGVPTPSITWKVNGDIIVASAKYIVIDDALIINKPNKKDSNSYTCEVKNYLGHDSATFKVKVQFPPNIVTSSTSAYTSVEGKDAVMRIPCAATGLPKPVITWMVDGAAISESTKFSIQDGSLIIREPKVSDTGSYTCVAQNDAGATRVSFQANILQIPDILGDKSKTIKKGDSTTIECDVVKGVPRPSIKWYFKGKSSSEFVPLTGRTELNIEKADKTHTGTYKCVAQNVIGRKEHRTDLTVEFAPTILSDDSKTLTGVEGDIALRIPCEADGVPTPSITWKVNGDIIVASAKYIVNDDALTINKPNKKDSNSYTCEVKNYLGHDNATFKVEVQFPPNIVTSSTSAYTSVEGKDAVMRIPCNATGLPKPVITWMVDGAAISESTKFSIQDGSLIIREPKVSDTGSYTCVAQNDAGATRASFQANILQIPDILGDKSKTIKKGDSTTIKCDVVKGVPRPSIKWYFKAKSSSEFVPLTGRTELNIEKADKTHTGTYKCVAQNVIGRKEHRTDLTVEFAPSILSDDSKTLTGVEGDIALRIPCKADGVPTPSITWKVNGDIIVASAKYIVNDDALTINKPNNNDSNSYTCEVKNYLGHDNATFKVEVQFPPNIVTSSTSAYTSVEGKDAVMRIPCAATGLPKPVITWMVDGAAISESTKFSIQDGSLIIREPKVRDTGSYTCVAQNDAGATRTSFQANILQIPDILGDKSKTIKKGHSTTIKCDVVKGVPRPSIKWYFKAKSSSEFVPLTGRTELNIEKADKTQTGTYKCVAQNVIGRKEHRTDLTVEFSPSILSDDSKTLTGVEGDIALRIPCEADGVPTPSITWKVNGDIIVASAKYIVNDDALIINKPNKKDSNSYTCEVKNYLGHDNATFKVEVQFPPNIVTSSTSAYTSVEGKDAVMRIPCAATGLPKPVITWMVDGAAISESTKFSIQDGSLIIREPKVSDTGSYTCVAQNDAGATRASFQANILQIPDILGDKSKTIKKGHSTTIKCDVVKGVPRPSIKWYFKAKSSSEFVPLTGRTELNIEKADKTHIGTYKCVAQNVIGRKEHRTDLTVEFAPKILSDDSKTLTGVEGDIALRIPCKADGVPTPSITWKVNGDIIVASAKYIVNDDALIINKPNNNDSNSYTCEVKNYLGHDNATFKVEVQSFIDDFGPKETLNVILHKDVKLECGLTNSSQSVTWFLEGGKTGIKGNYYHLRNVEITSEGNYTCRVSDASGARTKTYVVIVGYPPAFSNTEHEPLYDWSGSENDVLDCDVQAKPAAIFTWTYNGKLLKGVDSSRADVAGNWGHYTCNVSNVHGTITRSFEVFSSQCLISRKPENIKTMPLILSPTSTFPVLSGTTHYLKVEPGEKVKFSCPNDKHETNNETVAICDKQDIFTVQGIPHKVSDLQCAEESVFHIIKNSIKKCLSETSELIRVGFKVDGFLETYEVCFDVSKRMPLFTRAVMSKSTGGPGTTYQWEKYPKTVEGAEDKTIYTCDHSFSTNCYSKTQLVNVRDFVDGPAQSSTFIDPLNVVPCWRPANMTQSPWESIESVIRSRLDTFDEFIAWSGTHTVEKINGGVIPRYLWKVLWFDEDESIAIVYVNGPSPTKKDVLCKNICPDKQSVEWFTEINNHTYCCKLDDFLRAFNLRDTTVGESMEAALDKIKSKKYTM